MLTLYSVRLTLFRVKTALNLMGMEVGPLRMPLCEMEEANLNKLKTALKNYGLLK